MNPISAGVPLAAGIHPDEGIGEGGIYGDQETVIDCTAFAVLSRDFSCSESRDSYKLRSNRGSSLAPSRAGITQAIQTLSCHQLLHMRPSQRYHQRRYPLFLKNLLLLAASLAFSLAVWLSLPD